MTAFWRILEGDCRDSLRSLPERSVQTCVTSPPYFGLRDYGHDGQIGLEATPDEFVAALVGVFREVRRVLRDDGTVWLNLGDSYASDTKGSGGTGKSGLMCDGRAEAGRQSADTANSRAKFETRRFNHGLKTKDLIGIPWAVAFALRADGWYLRSDIIWSKPNPMPESVTDRPTKAHEYLFLLSKGPRYFYDQEAIREGSDHPHLAGREQKVNYADDSALRNDGDRVAVRTLDRNRRSVWTVATQPYPGAHFATFPPKLIEPCILAGTSPKACGGCGSPWRRVMEGTGPDQPNVHDRHTAPGQTRHRGLAMAKVGSAWTKETVAWKPSCEHNDDSGSCVVLDPFSGSGTTGMVALRHDRSYIGCERSPQYVQLSRDRIIADSPLLNTYAEGLAMG